MWCLCPWALRSWDVFCGCEAHALLMPPLHPLRRHTYYATIKVRCLVAARRESREGRPLSVAVIEAPSSKYHKEEEEEEIHWHGT